MPIRVPRGPNIGRGTYAPNLIESLVCIGFWFSFSFKKRLSADNRCSDAARDGYPRGPPPVFQSLSLYGRLYLEPHICLKAHRGFYSGTFGVLDGTSLASSSSVSSSPPSSPPSPSSSLADCSSELSPHASGSTATTRHGRRPNLVARSAKLIWSAAVCATSTSTCPASNPWADAHELGDTWLIANLGTLSAAGGPKIVLVAIRWTQEGPSGIRWKEPPPDPSDGGVGWA